MYIQKRNIVHEEQKQKQSILGKPGLKPHSKVAYFHSLADPGFGQGGDQKFFPRFCRFSKAESGEQREPILAGVQGPP